MDGLSGSGRCLAGSLARRLRCCRSRRTHCIEPHWPVDVLQRTLADVFESEAGLSPDLIERTVREAHSTRFAFTLDACRHIHAIAKDVVVVDDDVTDIDTDAKVDLYDRSLVSLDHLGLHGHRARYGIYDACKLHQHAVAGRLNDAAIVLGDSRIDDFTAVRLEGSKSADLVRSISRE